MSGGSWEYLYRRMEDAGEQLVTSTDPRRAAFGRLMLRCAEAMHDIEWVDSCDYGKGDEIAAIDRALGSPEPVRAEAITIARKAAQMLLDAIATERL